VIAAAYLAAMAAAIVGADLMFFRDISGLG
jgi:hypothetical protein